MRPRESASLPQRTGSTPQQKIVPPTPPNLLSQSLSRAYGSILPTSLTYILLSTRGFSPRRPAAVMSTAGRNIHSRPRIFTGQQARAGHNAKVCVVLSQASRLFSRQPDSKARMGINLLKRKENSFQGACGRLRVGLCYHSRDGQSHKDPNRLRLCILVQETYPGSLSLGG